MDAPGGKTCTFSGASPRRTLPGSISDLDKAGPSRTGSKGTSSRESTAVTVTENSSRGEGQGGAGTELFLDTGRITVPRIAGLRKRREIVLQGDEGTRSGRRTSPRDGRAPASGKKGTRELIAVTARDRPEGR